MLVLARTGVPRWLLCSQSSVAAPPAPMAALTRNGADRRVPAICSRPSALNR